MLHFLDGEFEVVPASDARLICSDGTATKKCKRMASWKTRLRDQEELVPFCGCCVLYGHSQWGYDNRDELRFIGEFVRATALDSLGKNTLVPELDARHRLQWRDAERYVMGIVFTSRTLVVSFARVAQIQARMEELYGSGDEESGGEAPEDVPEASGGSDGQASERQGGGDHHGAESA